MKMLELTAGLGLWPFDTPVRESEPAEGQPDGDNSHDQRAIVVPEDLAGPEDLRPVMLHPARWPRTPRRCSLNSRVKSLPMRGADREQALHLAAG